MSTTSTQPVETTTTLGTTTTHGTTTTTPPTTTTVLPLTVAITRYGIPVRVSAISNEGWSVIDPCGDTKTVSKAFPVRNIQVVLDPGHGGKDPGARGPTGLAESELNLKVSLAVSQVLQERDIRTLLTRTGDYYIELDERVALGDAANSAAIVSIHHNAPIAATSNHPGTEVFAQSGDDESARLAGLLHHHVFETLSAVENIQWTSRWDAGALRVVNSQGGDAYSLVRKPQTTNALLEIAYLASPSEGQFLATDEYVQLIAPPIATAIEVFLTTDQTGTPLLQRPRVHNPTGGHRTCPIVDLE
ncbi:MAG: N-acetylmuramoyl-L-alanine amidase [Actinomycetota bacterium]|nr:N-acetylmuramoyl-L-alanine amidase [Actinomycetota bacterium]